MPGDHLEHLLAVTPNLSHLEYNFHSEIQDTDSSLTTFSADALSIAIARVKATLEVLRVSVHFYHAYNCKTYDSELEPNIEGILGSLGEFTKLRELEAPFALLLGRCPAYGASGAGELPPNLQHITFRDDMECYDDCLYPWKSTDFLHLLPQMVRSWSDSKPDLQRLSLSLHKRTRYWGEIAQERFKEMCQAAGLSSNVLKRDVPDEVAF